MLKNELHRNCLNPTQKHTKKNINYKGKQIQSKHQIGPKTAGSGTQDTDFFFFEKTTRDTDD
jgi:hypothetical protein